MSRLKILIVEDEGIVAMDIKARLETLGYSVPATVASGEEAITQVKKVHPDLVLMDIQIQGDMDGVETAECIYQDFDVPVIFLTANSDDITLQRAKVTGPFGYMLKPFEERELHTTIEMALYRHKLEQELKESKQWLATTLKSIGDAVIATDTAGCVNFMNPVAEVLTGWKHKDAFSKDIAEIFNIVNEETRTAVENPVTKALREGATVILANHTILVNRDGTEIPIDDSAAPIKDDKGNIIGVVLVFRDVTEHKNAEKVIRKYQRHLEELVEERTAELKESEKRFHDVSLSSADWIWEVDKNGKYTYTSGKVKQILGYEPDEIVGKTPFELMPEEEAKRVGEVFAIITAEKKPIIDLENWNLTKEGQKICLLTNGVPILNEKGDLLGYRGLDKDITERKRVEEQKRKLREELERAQRMESLGVLAGGVAHDLNNMLGPLVAYPQLLQEKLPPDSPMKDQLKRMEHAARRAAGIVQDLLTLARRGRYEMSPVDINKVIESYLESPDFSTLKARFPAISMDVHLDSTIPLIHGSSTHLFKIIMNLVINALDAMPAGGKLTIRTECKYLEQLIDGFNNIEAGKYNIITVSDTGIGINEKDIKRIFEPFYSNKEMGKSGSGLGLAIVYGVVKDHNGYIDILSELHEGTDFLIYFPISEITATADSKEVVCDIRGSEKILIVDDEAEQRDLATAVLSSIGYSVETVASGREAVEYLKKNTADVVVLDMIMEAGFDGLDTYRKILELHPAQKAVIVSGFAETDRVREAEKLGVSKYVRKPYTVQQLGKAIREALIDKTTRVEMVSPI